MMMTTSPLLEKKKSSYNNIISMLLLLATLSFPSTILAYPTGAGTCNAGDNAPVGHPSDALIGSLEEDGNFQLTLNDEVLMGGSTTQRSSSSPMIVSTNEDNVIRISGKDSNTMFRGFLLRVSSTSSSSSVIDLTSTLSNPTDNIDYQIRFNKDEEPDDSNNPEICDSGVAAATHTAGPNNQAYDKNSVEITWNIPSDVIPSGDSPATIDIEVTVVVDFANYFYTKYVVVVESLGEDEEENNNENSGGFSTATTTTMTITTVLVMMMMNLLLL